MKKIVGLLLIGIIGVTLASCGEKKDDNKSQTESSSKLESTLIRNQESNSDSEKPNEGSQSKEINLVLEKEFPTDDDGVANIKGTTLPGAKVKISIDLFNSTKADDSGYFELKYNSNRTDKHSINIVSSKDGEKIKKSVSILPSEQFIKLEEQKKAEKEAEKNAKKEEKSKNKAEKENKSIQEKENKKNSSNSNYDAANNEIAENLRLKQGWASGTIDSDGNPTDKGTPNPEYNNWMYVNSIVYSGTDIEVQVTADFQSFSSSEKDLLASSSQGIVMSSTDLTERPHIFFFNGENAYGGSKVFSANEYKWY